MGASRLAAVAAIAATAAADAGRVEDGGAVGSRGTDNGLVELCGWAASWRRAEGGRVGMLEAEVWSGGCECGGEMPGIWSLKHRKKKATVRTSSTIMTMIAPWNTSIQSVRMVYEHREI